MPIIISILLQIVNAYAILLTDKKSPISSGDFQLLFCPTRPFPYLARPQVQKPTDTPES